MEMKSYPLKLVGLAGKDCFLDFIDLTSFYKDGKDSGLGSGRIQIKYQAYGSKEKYSCSHYVAVGEILTLIDDLLGYRFRANKSPKERGDFAPLLSQMRGAAGAAYGHPEWILCSSTLKVTVANSTAPGRENDKVVFFEIYQTVGEKTATGLVQPVKNSPSKSTKFNCFLSDLRPKMALMKAYIEAKLTTSKLMRNVHIEDQARWEASQEKKKQQGGGGQQQGAYQQAPQQQQPDYEEYSGEELEAPPPEE